MDDQDAIDAKEADAIAAHPEGSKERRFEEDVRRRMRYAVRINCALDFLERGFCVGL